MRIGLKQANRDKLISSLYEVSDPAHPRYGLHLSQDEVNALVAPHPDSVDLVESWLSHHAVDPSSIVHKTGGGDFITLRISVEQAERMLGTKYNIYHHDASGEYVVRTMTYSIDVVSPTTYFGTMRSMHTTSFLQPNIGTLESDPLLNHPGSLATVPEACSEEITPSCLRTLYNTIGYTPQATSTNKLGIAGYLQEYANYADLQTFFTKFRTDAVGVNFTTVLVNEGLDDQSQPGLEYGEGMSCPTLNIYYSQFLLHFPLVVMF